MYMCVLKYYFLKCLVKMLWNKEPPKLPLSFLSIGHLWLGTGPAHKSFCNPSDTFFILE